METLNIDHIVVIALILFMGIPFIFALGMMRLCKRLDTQSKTLDTLSKKLNTLSKKRLKIQES